MAYPWCTIPPKILKDPDFDHLDEEIFGIIVARIRQRKDNSFPKVKQSGIVKALNTLTPRIEKVFQKSIQKEYLEVDGKQEGYKVYFPGPKWPVKL